MILLDKGVPPYLQVLASWKHFVNVTHYLPRQRAFYVTGLLRRRTGRLLQQLLLLGRHPDEE